MDRGRQGRLQPRLGRERALRRLALILAAAGGALAAVVLLAGCGSSGQPKVAALFDDTMALSPGQDVHVAGVTVGSVDSIELTQDRRSLVTMTIDPRFARFYSNARCAVDNKFLLGERFVSCDPGRPSAGPLPQRDGVPTVPLAQTSSPVEGDLVLSIATLPYRQRLQIIINELGQGFSARGGDLNEVIRRADPALADARTAMRIVNAQRARLESGIRDTNRVLASLAARRADVGGLIDEAARVGNRVAAHRGELEQSVHELPALLTQLRPALEDVNSIAVNSTPFVAGLGTAAPQLHRLLLDVRPLSLAALPTLDNLGRAARVGRKAMDAARPAIKQLRPVAHYLRSIAPLLNEQVQSLAKAGFGEGLLRFFFYGTGAASRFDSISHILPSRGEINACSPYDTGAPIADCAALFHPGSRATSAATGRRAGHGHRRSGRQPAPAPAGGGTRGAAPAPGAPAPGAAAAPGLPPAPLPGGGQAPGLGSGGRGILDFLLGP